MITFPFKMRETTRTENLFQIFISFPKTTITRANRKLKQALYVYLSLSYFKIVFVQEIK